MNAGKYILIGFLIMIGIGIYNNYLVPEKDRIENSSQSQYFSTYDGSNPELIQYVKKNMKDPESFDHVSTNYSDNENGTLKVNMVYTGKDSFGGVVKHKVTADFNMGTHSLKNIQTDL